MVRTNSELATFLATQLFSLTCFTSRVSIYTWRVRVRVGGFLTWQVVE